MRNRKHTRGLSLPSVRLAGGTVRDNGLCGRVINRETGRWYEHHPEHTEACGHMEAEPGQPCQHEHTKDCYTNELNLWL